MQINLKIKEIRSYLFPSNKSAMHKNRRDAISNFDIPQSQANKFIIVSIRAIWIFQTWIKIAVARTTVGFETFQSHSS